MRTLLLSLVGAALLSLASTLSAATPASFATPITVTSTNAANPVQLSTDATILFTSVTFTGAKAARTMNTGRVWIQTAATNDTIGIPLETGGTVTISAPAGKYFRASDFYIDVETANDGVTAFFIQ